MHIRIQLNTNAHDRWLTSSRSIPSASRLAITDNFETFHLGYSSKFGSLPTPGQTSSFGVLINLAFIQKTRYTIINNIWYNVRNKIKQESSSTVLLLPLHVCKPRPLLNKMCRWYSAQGLPLCWTDTPNIARSWGEIVKVFFLQKHRCVSYFWMERVYEYFCV
jgi:hypothetical protein